MMKRLLSVILTLAMLASLFTGLTLTAEAVDAPAAGSYVIAANVNGTYYAMSASFGSKIDSKTVTVTDGKVSAAEAAGYTVTLASTADGYTISNGEVYLAHSSSTNFKTVTTVDDSALWTVSDGVLGTYRIANVKTDTRGIIFRANNNNKFGAYATSNVTANGTEYFDLEILPIDNESVWTWDGNPGANGYHTEVNQNNETRQVACTPGEGVIDPAPTCIATGTESFYCTVCSALISSNELPLGPHNYVNGVCTVCGAEEPVLDSYELVSYLRAGDRIIFVDQEDAKAAGALGGSGTSTYLTAVDATLGEGTAVSEDALVFEVEAGSAAGTFRFKAGDAWLTASKAASSNNYLYLVSEEPEDPADLDWTVTIENGTADVSYCAGSAANGRHLRYNVNNGTPRFSGYTGANSTIRDASIYKLATGEDLVDVYFVDQDDNAAGWFYAFGSGVENAPFPGEQMTAEGQDENGDSWYKITLDRSVYTNVIFSGGDNSTQTGNLSLGDGAYVVYYVNGQAGWEGTDVWPGPGTVIEPTCTEPGCTRYVGLLTGEVHEKAPTDPLEHDWGPWTFNNDNTHTRVCGYDESHTETEVCVDDDHNGVCDVCGGTLAQISTLVSSGAYVIAAKIGDVYYALPNTPFTGTPDGTVISVSEGAVSAADAEGYVFNLNTCLDGSVTIDNGESYLGGGSSGTSLRALSTEELLTGYFRWTVTEGEAGSFRVTNVQVSGRCLAFHYEIDGETKQNFQRFGFYAASNFTNNAGSYYDIELLPVLGEVVDSNEEIDVYFVDQTGAQNARVLKTRVNPDPTDTSEDLIFPGALISPVGTDKDGSNYYMLTVKPSYHATVEFNNGSDGAANRTGPLDYKTDARTGPEGYGNNKYVVYYIYMDNGEMHASAGDDLWPAPGEVTEATCVDAGYITYTGLRTGFVITVPTDPALGHDFSVDPDETDEEHYLAPSCTDIGLKYLKCSRCGVYSDTAIEIEALGHDMVAGTVHAPTCIAEGYTEYHCSRCDYEDIRDIVDAMGHDFSVDPDETDEAHYLAPSCTDTGLKYRKCSRCDVYSDTAIEIEALGHLAGEAVEENRVEPTATEAGGYDTVVYCSRCGFEMSRVHTVLEATGVDSNLLLFPSVSVGAEMYATFSMMESSVANYDHWYVEIRKMNPNGDPAIQRFGDGQEGQVTYIPYAQVYTMNYKGVNAKEMGTTFVARIHAFDAENHETLGPEYPLTIQSYVIEQLLEERNTPAQRKMYADVLNYGAAAQQFFGYDVENLVNENLSAEAAAALDQYETKEQAPAEKDNTANHANIFPSISFVNRLVLNATLFQVNESGTVTVDVYNVTKDEQKATLETTQNYGMYFASLSNINVDEMRNEFRLQVMVNGTAYGEPYVWSVEGYVKKTRNNPSASAEEVGLMNAMLIYADSVYAYFYPTN